MVTFGETIILDRGNVSKFKGVLMSSRTFWLKHGRRTRRWVVFVLASTAVWLLVSSAVAYKLTGRQGRRALEPAPQVTWGAIECLRLPTRDGEELGAWFVDGREQKPSVLLLHGIKGNRGHMLDRAKLLAAQGY